MTPKKDFLCHKHWELKVTSSMIAFTWKEARRLGSSFPLEAKTEKYLSNSINLVDEDNARGSLLGCCKKGAHSQGADAD